MEEIVEKAKNYSYSVKAVNVFNKLKKGTGTLEDSINVRVPKLVVKGKCEQETSNGYQLVDFNSPSSLYNGTYDKTTKLYTTSALNGDWVGINIWVSSTPITINTGVNEYYYSADIRIKSGTYTQGKINSFRTGSTFSGVVTEVSAISNPTLTSTFQRYVFKAVYTNNNENSLTDNNHFIQLLAGATDLVLEIKDVMISKTNVPYEKYTGGIASPNPDYPSEVKTVKGKEIEGLKGKWLEVKSTGKNMVKPITGTSTRSGLTYTYNSDNDTINIKGTTTSSNVSIPLTDLRPVLKKGITYTQSVITVSGKQENINIVPSVRNSNGGVSYNYFNNNMAKTPTEDLTINAYNAFSSVNGATIDWTFKVQLEEGSVATPYEPYKESTALIDMNKKNLFDKDKFIHGTWDTSNGPFRIVAFGEMYLKGTSITIKNLNTAKYKFSVGFSTLNTQSGNTIVNESGWVTNDNYTITAINDGYLWLQVSKLDNSNITPSELLETDFKIYEGIGTDDTYEFCSIGDPEDTKELSKSMNKTTQRIGKVVLDGSETIIYENAYPRFRTNGLLSEYNDTKRHPIKSNYFHYLPSSIEDGGAFAYYKDIYLCDFRYTDVDSFKAHLQELYNAGTPLEVYYELATPIEIEQEVIDLPYAYEDATHISSNDELAEVEVDYYSKEIPNMNKLKVEIKEI